MENAQKSLVVKNCQWSDDAAQVLSAAIDYCHIDDLKSQVESGAQLFSVEQDHCTIGYYILRVDALIHGFEGVIVAIAGRTSSINLIDALYSTLEKQFTGCNSLRVHTARCGLIKKLTKIGFTPQEFVMRKELSYG